MTILNIRLLSNFELKTPLSKIMLIGDFLYVLISHKKE